MSQESLMKDIDTTYLRKLIDTAKTYYPKVKSFNHSLVIAEENIKKAKVSWFDLITFSYSYSPSNTTTIVNPTLSGSQVGLYFNVGNLLIKPHNIKQAKEEFAIVQLNKEAYILNIEAEVKARYYRYVQQVNVLKVQQESALDLETLVKQAKYKFEKGEEKLENYSQIIVQYNEQRQIILTIEGAVLTAKSSLEELICKKLELIR
ncbi:MAG: TolC family protein [Deinococcales bacterium]|nr:TolC family protein [Chitinophagaceae bacterium]